QAQISITAYRVPTSVGFFVGVKGPTKVGTLYAVSEASQNHPPIPFPPRHPLTIEILKQRNCVLAGNAGEFLERRDVDRAVRTPRCAGAQLPGQVVERRMMKEHLAGHAHQYTRIN